MDNSFYILDNIDTNKPVLKYAGFWIRFFAKFIDGIIIAISAWFLSLFIPDDTVESLLIFIVPILYQAYWLSTPKGATIGKNILGIKVIKTNGQTLTFGQAVIRCLAEYISGIILYIGYIIAAFDSKKQSLHDKICNTYVVYA